MKHFILGLVLLVALSSCEKDDDSNPGPSSPRTPVSIQLETIFMVGFDQTNSLGQYWDSSTNPPDPFIQVFKGGTLVYASTHISNASYNTSYEMYDQEDASVTIVLTEGEDLRIVVREPDSATETQYMGELSIDDALNFFYDGNQATQVEDFPVSTSNGHVRFEISGKLNY